MKEKIFDKIEYDRKYAKENFKNIGIKIQKKDYPEFESKLKKYNTTVSAFFKYCIVNIDKIMKYKDI